MYLLSITSIYKIYPIVDSANTLTLDDHVDTYTIISHKHISVHIIMTMLYTLQEDE